MSNSVGKIFELNGAVDGIMLVTLFVLYFSFLTQQNKVSSSLDNEDYSCYQYAIPRIKCYVTYAV